MATELGQDLTGTLEQVPAILSAAAESPLAFASLVVLTVAILAYYLLPKTGYQYLRLVVLIFLATGFFCLTYVVISSSHNERPGQPQDIVSEDVQRIIIGGKQFLESNVLLEMMALVIENKLDNVIVERKYYYDETTHVYDALKAGKIDLYPEYTGTILASHLQTDPNIYLDKDNHTRSEINRLLAKHKSARDLEILDRFGFNNSFVLAMTKQRAAELVPQHLWLNSKEMNISALAEAIRNQPAGSNEEIVFGTLWGFHSRKGDGYAYLKMDYNLKFKSVSVTIDKHENKLGRLLEGAIDVTDFYSTDPYLENERIVALKDNKGFFPEYHAVPFIRKHIKYSRPEIVLVLERLRNICTDEDMKRLLAEIHQQKVKASDLKDDSSQRGPITLLRQTVKKFLQEKDII